MARRSLRASDIACHETFSPNGVEDGSRWAKIISALFESEELGDLKLQGRGEKEGLTPSEQPGKSIMS